MTEASADELRELLQATIDHVAQQPGARKLCRALALADGFQFQLVACNTTRLSTALQLWLERAVVAERGAAMRFERLSPYPLDWRAPGPAVLEIDDLIEPIFAQLINIDDDEPRCVIIDGARATAAHAPAWQQLMMRLNERRNFIGRVLGWPLTMIVPQTWDAMLARAAPDLWSIRSVAIELRDGDEGTPLIVAFEQPDEAPSVSGEELEQLRQRAAAGSQAASAALRVQLLRLAGQRMRDGPFDEAAALIAEAEVIAGRLGDRAGEAACWLARSEFLIFQEQHDAALSLIDRALATFSELGDKWALADAWGRRGWILQARGQLDEALRIYEDVELPIHEHLGDTRGRMVVMGRIADVLAAKGEFDEALRLHEQVVLPYCDAVGDIRMRAVTRGRIASILEQRGELDEALGIRTQEELPVYERLGDVTMQVLTHGRIANLLTAQGQLDPAIELRRRTRPMLARLGLARQRIDNDVGLALALRQRGRAEDQIEIGMLLRVAFHEARQLGLSDAERIAKLLTA